MRDYVQLKHDQFSRARATAKQRFITEELGPRPTIESIKADLPNQHRVDILEWVAMFVLLVLAIFTSFKAGGIAIPMSHEAMLHLTAGTHVSAAIEQGFTLFFVLTMILLATPGLVYFKLLDEAPSIYALKQRTASYPYARRLSWAYLSPRIPGLFVYAIVGWLVAVSSYGRPMEGNLIEKISIAGARYIPVVAEIGLAYLVGTVLDKQRKFNAEALSTWKEKVAPWDKAYKDAETQPEYLRMLFLSIREALIAVRRKSVSPNAWMENADQGEVREAVLAEYRRHQHAGLEFAREVQGVQVAKAQAVKEMKDEKSILAGKMTGKRRPDKGMSAWSPSALVADFKQRGLDPRFDYNESTLQADYAPNFGARSAWRRGAKRYFKSYQED